MHARFQHDHEFPELGLLLNPSACESDFDCDVENVYQWMYVTLAQFDATLNISRDHGWSSISDEIESQYDVNDPRLLALVHPGPTYAISCGHDRKSRPEILWYDVAQYIADSVNVPVDLLHGALNVDVEDSKPIATLIPRGPSV